MKKAKSVRQQWLFDDELDVLIYCLLLSDTMGIDPLEIMEDKLKVNREKYPVEAARGTARKYTELQIWDTKGLPLSVPGSLLSIGDAPALTDGSRARYTRIRDRRSARWPARYSWG